MRKKMIALIVGLVSLAVLGMSGVSSYLSDAETMINHTIVGGNTIEIVETFEPPEKVQPGTVITKEVKIKNCGPNDCYVRVRVVFSSSAMENYCTVDWNINDFVYRSDGYYYYPNVLKKGETTPSLFTNITVSSEISQEQIKEFSVIVYAESYQAEGFVTDQEAWNHAERNES